MNEAKADLLFKKCCLCDKGTPILYVSKTEPVLIAKCEYCGHEEMKENFTQLIEAWNRRADNE